MIHASWPSRILQVGAIGAGTSVAAFFISTKHCEIVDPLDASSEPLFHSAWYRLYNPRNNTPLADACVRRVPLRLLKYDLLVDAKAGGPKLVEAFAQGCFGGHNFTIQRLLHKRGLSPEECERVLPGLPVVDDATTATATTTTTATSASPSSPSLSSRLASLWRSTTPSPPPPASTSPPSTPASPPPPAPEHLWTRAQLLASPYTPGTIVANHFVVLAHTPTSILVRCGSSPFDTPAGPRASDGLFEFAARPDFDRGFVEFRLTSVFYDGQAADWPAGKEVMGPTIKWLHQQYAKLWMESAIRNCRMSKFRSQRSQVEIAKGEIAKAKADDTITN